MVKKRKKRTPDRKSSTPVEAVMQKALLTPDDAATYLEVAKDTLNRWRINTRQAERLVAEGKSAELALIGERGPAFFKTGRGLVRYRRVDLDAWIAANLHGVTSTAVA